jgi:hypothetical protein
MVDLHLEETVDEVALQIRVFSQEVLEMVQMDLQAVVEAVAVEEQTIHMSNHLLEDTFGLALAVAVAVQQEELIFMKNNIFHIKEEV